MHDKKDDKIVENSDLSGNDTTTETLKLESDQKPRTPINSIKNNIYISPILLALIFIIGMLLNFLFRQNSVKQDLSSLPEITIQTDTPVPTRIPYNPPKQKMWLLKKALNSSDETVLTICGNCYFSYVGQLGDWLFYPSFENKSIQIKSYNFQTEKGDTVYDLDQNATDFQRGIPSDLSDMQIIGNTLFFSFGGYLRQGAIFWVEIPPVNKPQKLTDSRNAKITYWKDRYWIIEGEGDACWGITDYSLVDISTKKVNRIASSTSGCYEGEEFIDIDKRNRMIFAFHTQDFGEKSKNKQDGIYQYVIAIPLNDPQIKEGIIAKQEMPSGVTSVSYLPDSDQLFLKGTESFLYDFSTKTISKTAIVPIIPTSTPRATEKTFKDRVSELVLPSGYELILE